MTAHLPPPGARRWAVLLRGVNVNGVTVRSADLRDCLTAAGLDEVATVLASGNAVVTTGRDGPDLRAVVEAALRDRFAYQAWVVVRPVADLGALLAACPLAERLGWHTYAVFASDPAALAELAAADVDTDPRAPADGVLWWQVREGHSTDTPFAKVLARTRYRATTTTRNRRTVERIAALG